MQMQFSDFSSNKKNARPSEGLSFDAQRLSQVFNTALVHSRVDQSDDPKELFKLMERPAFAAILNCLQSYAREQGISEIDSAKEIIRTFRKIDQIWTSYLIQEGTERMKS